MLLPEGANGSAPWFRRGTSEAACIQTDTELTRSFAGAMRISPAALRIERLHQVRLVPWLSLGGVSPGRAESRQRALRTRTCGECSLVHWSVGGIENRHPLVARSGRLLQIS